jgi:hypothetical protein
MKKLFFIIALLCLNLPLFSQKAKSKATSVASEIKIQMTAARWDFPINAAEFISHKNVPAMKILSGDRIILKDLQFSDGTIEFDMEPQQEPFAGIFFRMADNNETEYFYLRIGRAGNLTAMDAAQYAAFIKGVNLWDLLDYYQGPANFKKNEWNHIKLVVSGRQMLVYVNDMVRPTLEIPRLEGNTNEGKLAFNGRCVIANLVVKPGEVEGLPSKEGFDPTHHDPRYIRTWQVTDPQPLPRGRELYDGDFPKPTISWQDIKAERRGLINMTRMFGASESRRYVWLRTKLISATDQTRKISMGFSDEVWVYVNRQPLFVDKNIYTSPQMRKDPDGRIAVENAQFEISLQAGENELLVGVANDFFGWGLIARLDKMDGNEVSTDFPPPVVQPKDLSPYTGNYRGVDVEEKLMFTSVNDVLMGQSTGQPPVELEYFDKDKFSLNQAGVVLEFYPADKKLILKQGGRATTFVKE